MTANTFVELDSAVVSGTTTNTITFQNISQNYTNLFLVMNLKLDTSTTYPRIRFNNETGNFYSDTTVYATSTTAIAGRDVNVSSAGYLTAGAYANTNNFAWHAEVDIFSYSNATTNKTFLARVNNASYSVDEVVGLWRKTEAITRIDLVTNAGYYSAGSTFSLYGIKAWQAETTPKATGGYVYSDSTYWYHAFPFSSTFTPSQSLTADILVVAGGGGGGGETGGNGNGGGGAGGLLTFTSQALSATSYTVTVGAGGLGGRGTRVTTNGGNSQFGALTACVGGGAGAHYTLASGNYSAVGGSGGGGQGSNDNSHSLGSAGTNGQGNAGGDGYLTGGGFESPGGGGGGGAGGAGAKGGNGIGGAGGVGLTSSFTNAIGAATGYGETISSNTYFAGGGAGSTSWSAGIAFGGYGGGGDGYFEARNGEPGAVSTGGGGGAGRGTGYDGGNGGSGIVIVRYAI